MFPAATAVTVARNVARRGVFESFLSLCSSSGKSRYVFSRPVKKECNNWDISHFL